MKLGAPVLVSRSYTNKNSSGSDMDSSSWRGKWKPGYSKPRRAAEAVIAAYTAQHLYSQQPSRRAWWPHSALRHRPAVCTARITERIWLPPNQCREEWPEWFEDGKFPYNARFKSRDLFSDRRASRLLQGDLALALKDLRGGKLFQQKANARGRGIMM